MSRYQDQHQDQQLSTNIIYQLLAELEQDLATSSITVFLWVLVQWSSGPGLGWGAASTLLAEPRQ